MQHADPLEQRLSGGASWFYWIAGLSLINSTIILFGGEWSFIVGLGITQVIDALALAVAQEVGAGAATATQVIGFAGAALVAGVFVLFGVFAHRRQGWAFVVGMVLYLFDGLLFVLVADWLSIGFHAFALFCIWSGYSACRQLSVSIPRDPSTEPEPIRP